MEPEAKPRQSGIRFLVFDHTLGWGDRGVAKLRQALYARLRVDFPEAAVRAENAEDLRSGLPEADAISASGHGTASSVFAATPTVLALSKMPDSWRSGSVVHLLSCYSGLRLGPEIARRGASFIGYVGPVTLPRRREGWEAFVAADFEVERALASMRPPEEAFEAARAAMRETARCSTGLERSQLLSNLGGFRYIPPKAPGRGIG